MMAAISRFQSVEAAFATDAREARVIQRLG